MIAYTKFEVLRTVRNVRYLVFLVAMPVAFELIWGKQGPGVMVAMAVYATCGGALLGSGNTIAEDRLTGWLRQLRVTPLPNRAWLAGKITQGLLTVLPGVALVCVVGAIAIKVRLSPVQWLAMVGVMLVGALPFVLVGVFFGMVFRGKTAVVALMVVFFALMFSGGVIGGNELWRYSPTNSLMEIGMGVLNDRAIGSTHLINLGIWALLAGIAVLLRWRRA